MNQVVNLVTFSTNQPQAILHHSVNDFLPWHKVQAHSYFQHEGLRICTKSPCVTQHGLSICYLLLLFSRKSCSDLQHATKNWAWWFCDKWGNLYSHPSPCSHPPSLSAGWPLPSRCVTELLSCHTGGINYRTRSSWCHCSVINGLSRRCAMGPGLTVNSTGIQRQTHTHSEGVLRHRNL